MKQRIEIVPVTSKEYLEMHVNKALRRLEGKLIDLRFLTSNQGIDSVIIIYEPTKSETE